MRQSKVEQIFTVVCFSLALFARKSSIPHFSGKNVNLKLTSDQVLALLNCTGPVYTATLLTSIS